MRNKPTGGSIRVEQFPYLATYYLGFNVRNGDLRELETRRAIAQSIDLEKIPSVLQGGQVVAHSWLPPEMEGHERGKPLQVVQNNPGVLPHLSFLVEKFDGAEAVSSFIAKSVKEKLGVTLIPTIELPSDFQRILKGKQAALFLTHWGADVPDPVDFFRVFAKSSGTNYTGWTNPEYDRRIDEALATEDPAARKAAFGAAEEILLKKEVVILPLFYKKNTALLGARIDRFRISPLNYLFLKDVTLKAR